MVAEVGVFDREVSRSYNGKRYKLNPRAYPIGEVKPYRLSGFFRKLWPKRRDHHGFSPHLGKTLQPLLSEKTLISSLHARGFPAENRSHSPLACFIHSPEWRAISPMDGKRVEKLWKAESEGLARAQNHSQDLRNGGA